jgi:hypothetical protein
MGLNRVGFVALVRLNEMRVTCSSRSLRWSTEKPQSRMTRGFPWPVKRSE